MSGPKHTLDQYHELNNMTSADSIQPSNIMDTGDDLSQYVPWHVLTDKQKRTRLRYELATNIDKYYHNNLSGFYQMLEKSKGVQLFKLASDPKSGSDILVKCHCVEKQIEPEERCKESNSNCNDSSYIYDFDARYSSLQQITPSNKTSHTTTTFSTDGTNIRLTDGKYIGAYVHYYHKGQIDKFRKDYENKALAQFQKSFPNTSTDPVLKLLDKQTLAPSDDSLLCSWFNYPVGEYTCQRIIDFKWDTFVLSNLHVLYEDDGFHSSGITIMFDLKLQRLDDVLYGIYTPLETAFHDQIVFRLTFVQLKDAFPVAFSSLFQPSIESIDNTSLYLSPLQNRLYTTIGMSMINKTINTSGFGKSPDDWYSAFANNINYNPESTDRTDTAYKYMEDVCNRNNGLPIPPVQTTTTTGEATTTTGEATTTTGEATTTTTTHPHVWPLCAYFQTTLDDLPTEGGPEGTNVNSADIALYKLMKKHPTNGPNLLKVDMHCFVPAMGTQYAWNTMDCSTIGCYQFTDITNAENTATIINQNTQLNCPQNVECICSACASKDNLYVACASKDTDGKVLEKIEYGNKNGADDANQVTPTVIPVPPYIPIDDIPKRTVQFNNTIIQTYNTGAEHDVEDTYKMSYDKKLHAVRVKKNNSEYGLYGVYKQTVYNISWIHDPFNRCEYMEEGTLDTTHILLITGGVISSLLLISILMWMIWYKKVGAFSITSVVLCATCTGLCFGYGFRQDAANEMEISVKEKYFTYEPWIVRVHVPGHRYIRHRDYLTLFKGIYADDIHVSDDYVWLMYQDHEHIIRPGYIFQINTDRLQAMGILREPFSVQMIDSVGMVPLSNVIVEEINNYNDLNVLYETERARVITFIWKGQIHLNIPNDGRWYESDHFSIRLMYATNISASFLFIAANTKVLKTIEIPMEIQRHARSVATGHMCTFRPVEVNMELTENPHDIVEKLLIGSKVNGKVITTIHVSRPIEEVKKKIDVETTSLRIVNDHTIEFELGADSIDDEHHTLVIDNKPFTIFVVDDDDANQLLYWERGVQKKISGKSFPILKPNGSLAMPYTFLVRLDNAITDTPEFEFQFKLPNESTKILTFDDISMNYPSIQINADTGDAKKGTVTFSDAIEGKVFIDDIIQVDPTHRYIVTSFGTSDTRTVNVNVEEGTTQSVKTDSVGIWSIDRKYDYDEWGPRSFGLIKPPTISIHASGREVMISVNLSWTEAQEVDKNIDHFTLRFCLKDPNDETNVMYTSPPFQFIIPTE